MRRDRDMAGRRAQDGVALVMVLWLTVLMTVIGGAFAFSMRNEALASRNAVTLARVRTVADGAIERAAFELLRPRTTASWKADGASHRWMDGDLLVVTSARDETAKLDLNAGAEPLLKGLLTNVGGLDDASASALVDAIVDWRDADELRRPNGAEAGDYRSADSNYTPTNTPFETVGELSRVLGVTPALYARIAGALTVHSRQTGVNPQTASRQTLLAIPGATAEMIDDYVTRRDEAILQDVPAPPFPPAHAYLTGAVPVWRVQAQVVAPDGVTFVREAVVRATADPRRPFYALLWSEGERPPPSEAPASTAASAAPAAPSSTPSKESDARRS